MNKTIAVFGSSRPRQNEQEYKDAYRLGNILAKNGFDICTGGYQGIMDAVSRGAVESGGKAIGVTVDIFGSTPSKYLSKNIVCHTLFERIEQLIELGDAYVILKGGTGTMLELSAVWELMNKNLINEKPVVCHSSFWKRIIDSMEERIIFEGRKSGLIKTMDDIDDCAKFIIQSLNHQ